jgi:hypothetical protein
MLAETSLAAAFLIRLSSPARSRAPVGSQAARVAALAPIVGIETASLHPLYEKSRTKDPRAG